MATGNDVFGEVDDHEEYLMVLAMEAKEAILDRKVKEMQKKNRDILKRHAEVEADRKAAEDSGCAVTLKSNQQSQSDHHELPSEAPKSAEEDVARRRGRGQGWGRGRPRASRFRPAGHYGQDPQQENHAIESNSLAGKDSEKRLSPSQSYAGCDAMSDKHSPSGDWDTGPPSESSSSHLHESQSRPSNGGQKPRESSRGQRAMPGRGHSRGPFAKFVTVPDASHSHDVRHVEEVNNSIVINIDRSTRPGGDSTKRGGGGRGTGGGGGYSARNNSTGEMFEAGAGAGVGDQETGFMPLSDSAPYQKSGYRGQGRRPFRGRGDGYFRGRGEGSFRGQSQGQGRGDGFRRGRSDGPRPFRGGYKADWARGGRTSRRAVIVTSKSEGVDSSQHIPDPENWDKIVPAADSVGEAGASDGQCWTSAEGGGTKWDEGEGNHDPDRSEAFDSGHSYEESHKDLDLLEGEEIAHRDQPEELELPTAEQSECHSGKMGDQPKRDPASKDESISTQAEHSPNNTKPSETISELQVEDMQGGLGTQGVEKVREKSSSNTETDMESKTHKTNTVSNATEVVNPSSSNNDSHDSVPEKAAEATSGESKDAIKLSDLEVAGAVGLSSSGRNDSHDLVPEKALGGDSKPSDSGMSSSKPLPSAAAAESTVTSLQSEAPANVPLGESNSSEPSKAADSDLVEKAEAVNSEIPASVKEKT